MKPLHLAALLFTLALGLATVGHSQTTEKTGIGINPSFVGPAQYVETASGWKLLDNAGLGVQLAWMDQTTTNGVSSIQRAYGPIFEENFGQGTNATVNNAVLGLGAAYKGISAVIGFQIMGPSLGGPGSNGLVIGAAYDISQIIPGSAVFF